ncbi:Z1 domain-containing protein [Sinisalibacter aestuarii]|nr:Z1 domain-containing protein [Sinisalibacter aestuarii]
MIRDRRASYGSAAEVADVIKQELADMFGAGFEDSMRADVDEAARVVQSSGQDVEILRRHSIINDREKWYDGPGPNDPHWSALHSYLENTKGWDPDTIASIDEASNEVVSLLDNPTREQFACRGLVVGYVQSGKTANMTAVIAKAVDAGYNLIIVLGGVTNKLRKQTQDRFDADVVNRHRHLWQLYTTGEEDGDFILPPNRSFHMPQEGQAQLIVMKKEGSRLRKLKKTIEKTPPIILKKLKVLLIDDECDQASVNSARGDYDMTRINEEIRRVLKALPAVSYVGYTATPFANVFINPFPINDDDLDDLYPRDFITALERPKGYFGATEVFGSDSAEDEAEGRDMVRVLADDDPERVRPTKNAEKESFRPEMTRSLEDAILWFIATCAIRRLRGHADKHMTMLVHASQFVAQHQYMSELIESWVAMHAADLVGGTGEISARFNTLYEDECSRTAPEEMNQIPEAFDAVRAELGSVLDALDFPVENGISQSRLNYENGPATSIVVGGTVLARGLTLEGLTVSYFLRTSRQYDTLLQMGRWFGYRGGYDDLPRLWTTSDLISKFRSLAVIEEEIRRDIDYYQEKKLTPMDFAVRVREIPGMAITAASKMKHAHRTSMSFDGQHIQTIRFDHLNTDLLRGNWKTASALIDKAISRSGLPVNRERRVLFKDVPFEAVRRFILDTSISDEHMSLKKSHLLGYLDQSGVALATWHVGVITPGKGTTSARELGGLGKVPTNRRAKLKDAPARYADIKALMSKRDILIDVEGTVVGPDDWNHYKAQRPSVPLLLIYPIDANSPPQSGSKTRVALDAAEDVIGFGMVFPGQKDRSGGYYQVELDAPSVDQFEDQDELEELGEQEPADG